MHRLGRWEGGAAVGEGRAHLNFSHFSSSEPQNTDMISNSRTESPLVTYNPAVA